MRTQRLLLHTLLLVLVLVLCLRSPDSVGEIMQMVVPHLGVLRLQQKFQLGEVVEGVVRSMRETGMSVSKGECAVHCGSWLWVLTWRVCDVCLQMMFARQ